VEQRAVARLAAENAWLKFGLDHGVPVHVFRLGGIYGPGRRYFFRLSRFTYYPGHAAHSFNEFRVAYLHLDSFLFYFCGIGLRPGETLY
jgi:nucleoside-diphosphate-sugar epimerase